MAMLYIARCDHKQDWQPNPVDTPFFPLKYLVQYVPVMAMLYIAKQDWQPDPVDAPFFPLKYLVQHST